MNAYVRTARVNGYGELAGRAQATAAQAVRQGLTIILAILVFVSAFTVIYVKDLNRRLFIQDQAQQTQTNELYQQWSKLLLEQSTWSTQARVQHVAEKQLHMVMPSPGKIVMVKARGKN